MPNPNFGGMGGLIRRSGPPPGRKENVIQVMTAERREYSRVQGKFDSPMGPPFSSGGPGGSGDGEGFFEPDAYNYGYEPTQEQQWNNDQQPPGWIPTGVKELTPGPHMMVPPHMRGGPQMGAAPPHMGGGSGGDHKMMPPPGMDRGERGGGGDRGDRDRGSGGDRERERERPAERSSDRERSERDRDREYRERGREERVKSEVKIAALICFIFC